MGRHESVLFVDGSDRFTRVRESLKTATRSVSIESDADAIARSIRDRGVDVVVCTVDDKGPGVEAVRSIDASVPIVAILPDDVSPATALDAGATDCVTVADEGTGWETLIERRVDSALGSATRDIHRAHADALAATVDGERTLVCLVDDAYRHVTAVGTEPADGLTPDRFEGRTLETSPLDSSAIARVRAGYDAALDGEPHVTQITVDERPIRVETEPATTVDGYAIARYEAVVASRSVAADERTIRERIEQLREITQQLDDHGDVERVCEFVVETVSRLVDFDACVIGEAKGDAFDVLAATAAEPYASSTTLAAGDGIAGRTVETGRTHVIDDLDDEPTAAPTNDAYRSVLSIPMGAYGVFQAISTEPNAYTELDRKLGELLVVYATHAIAKLRFERALTHERDRFAALFQNIPDASIQYVFDGAEPRIESVNSAFVRLFGYEPDHAVGESVLDLLVPDDDRDDARTLYETVKDGDRVDAEVTRHTVDGSAPFLLRSVPVQSDDDSQRGYFIYTDISTLVEREHELKAKNERLDTFASIVSHDLRNPLSVAEGYLQAGLDTGEREHIEIVAEELDRMRRMVEDLLTLAREGEAVGDVTAVELDEVVEQAWDGVDTADATVSIGRLPTVEADAPRVRQLFENLFRNAVLHGGDDVDVTVASFEGGVYVADDGPGVPDELKSEILEMGVSTAKGDGGTGFGLSIVTQVAAGHGWDVEVTDSDCGGARFELRFDRDRDVAEETDDDRTASVDDAPDGTSATAEDVESSIPSIDGVERHE
ncbi:ATP-binding protein [Halovivax gelatinilyticus]|uniref:ATP-binding protein n=1 Tax=Halovivax gelatinilyticus TaxID=2961597 RepID=UPI0020CA55D2|nr:ATP-binding protein [Halovivax gelatinilyticus]